jgi:hypothetical protein
MKERYMRVRFVLSIGCLLSISSLAVQAESQPRPSWLGHHTVSVCARGSAPLYAPHLYRPTIAIDVSSGSSGAYNLRLQVQNHACDLEATASGDSLIVGSSKTGSHQICKLEIVTSDFCTLKQAECDAGGSRQSCSDEEHAGHLDGATGIVNEAKLSRHGNQTELSFNASIAGCVLVTGFNNNIPLVVKPGIVRSIPCQ